MSDELICRRGEANDVHIATHIFVDHRRTFGLGWNHFDYVALLISMQPLGNNLRENRTLPRDMRNAGLDPSLNLDSQILVDLLQVWQDARGDRAIPARSDLDPLTIGPARLPYILLVDVEHQPKRRYRWRLIGSHIVTVMKRDSTGDYWDDLYSSSALAGLCARADWVVQHQAPLRATGHAASKDRTPNIERFNNVETLYMPLSNNGETVDMLFLGAIHSSKSSSQN